jgi:protein-S-isoprenylcysteine O-methyltransferase Ste14
VTNTGADRYLAWFQVVCYFLFVASFLARVIYFEARRRINPITLSVGKKGALGVLEVLLFAWVNVWGFVVVLYSLPLEQRPMAWLFRGQVVSGPIAAWSGVVVILLAFLLFGLASAALGDSWRLGIDEQNPGRLVTGGIYALSRNPIYIFFDLWFVGTFLLNGILVFLVFAVLGIGIIHFQIVQEERSLVRIHGLAYVEYCAHTERYVNRRLWQLSRKALRPDAETTRVV